MSWFRLIPFAIVLCALLAAHHEKPTPKAEGVPDSAEYVRIYTGDDGESHFERVKVPLALNPETGRLNWRRICV